jgi:CubicO group peptidase (beta-lactamase class C family)
MALLGQLLAARAGMDYDTLVRTRITGPLEMHDTVIRLSPEKQTRFAKGHNASGKRVESWDISQAFAPAGALRSTVNDLFKYLRANMGLTETPLQSAIQRTQQPQYSNGFGGIYGLGWQILRELDGEIFLHGGGTGGYVTFIAFNPNRREGVVVLSNSGNNIKDIGLHLLDPAQFRLYKPAKERLAVTLPAATLDAYVGEYQAYRTAKSPALGEGLEVLTSYYFKVTREDTRLFVEPVGKRKAEVFAESDTDFFWLPREAKETLLLPDAQATFVRDGSGTVSHLVLHSNGIHQFAKKVR